MWFSPAAVAAGLTGLSLLAPAVASADATFDITPSGANAVDAQVAVNQAGVSYAVWVRFDGTNDVVQTRRISRDGSLGAVSSLSASGQNASQPQVAVDGVGNAFFTWVRSNGTNTIVQGQRLGADGITKSPVRDLSVTGRNAGGPDVAVDGFGVGRFVWTGRTNASPSIDIAQSAQIDANGVASSPSNLSAAGQNAVFAKVAADGQGNAFYTWRRSNGTYPVVQGVRDPRQGSLGTVTDLSPSMVSADNPQVAANGQGGAYFTWYTYGSGPAAVQTASVRTDGAYTLTQKLSGSDPSLSPQVATDAGGNAFFTWYRNTSDATVESRRLAIDGTLGALGTVSAPDNVDDPDVGVGPTGIAVYVWSNNTTGSKNVIQARRVAANGTAGAIGDISVLSEGIRDPRVAMDGQNTAYVVWERSDGSNTVIQGAVLAQPAPTPPGNTGGGSVQTNPGANTAPPASDTVAPVLSKVKLSSKVFAVDTKAKASMAARKKAKRGTTLSLSLSEPATLTITTQQKVKGKWKTLGSFKKGLKSGSRKVAYSGRIRIKRKAKSLKPGTYRLRVRPVDAAKNAGKTTIVGFRIVRR